MANSTTTLPEPFLLVTRLELVTPTTVAGTFYGIALTLFCLYVHSLTPRLRDEDRKRQARFMLGYSSVIMLCGLFDLVSNAWVTQEAYILHANHPGGSYGYIQSLFRTQPLVPVILACQLVVHASTSAIQVWRVWIIWSATRYAEWVVVLPSLCLLTFTALLLRSDILETTLPAAEIEHLDGQTQLAQSAIQGATTLLCTALIALYLVFQHWRQRKLIGKAQGSEGYMNVVAILIESYALESLWLLVAAAIWNYPAQVFFIETRVYIEIIAYLLVQYRVASGKAYESRRGQSNISSLNWNRSNHATTQFGGASEAGHNCHVPSIKPEADAVPVSDMA